MYNIDKQLIQRESEKVMYNIMESLQAIVEHLSNKPNIITPIEENNAANGDKRICKTCGKECNGQGELLKHINTQHKKGGK